MKNRRIILISFLLVTTLCVGIGYAAVQDTLTINGTASADAQQAIDGDVYFDKSSALVSSGSGASEGGEALDEVLISEDGNTAELTVASLRSQGETVVFDLVIRNDSPDLSVKVTPQTGANSNEEYFSVSYVWKDGSPSDFAETTITPGTNKTVTVTITLNKTPTADAGESATFSVEIDAVYDTSAG